MEIVELRASRYQVRLDFGRLYLWRDGDEVTMVDTGLTGSGLPSRTRSRAWDCGHRRSAGSAAAAAHRQRAPV